MAARASALCCPSSVSHGGGAIAATASVQIMIARISRDTESMGVDSRQKAV
jgi:hypothetical protein